MQLQSIADVYGMIMSLMRVPNEGSCNSEGSLPCCLPQPTNTPHESPGLANQNNRKFGCICPEVQGNSPIFSYYEEK